MGKNLKGFTAGNPSWAFTGPNFYWDFMHNHALLGDQEFAAAKATCGGGFSSQSKPCQNALSKLRENLVGICPYNMCAALPPAMQRCRSSRQCAVALHVCVLSATHRVWASPARTVHA